MCFLKLVQKRAYCKFGFNMETGIKVGDCMKSSLVTVPDSTPVVDAAKKMAQAKVGSLLVTDKKGIYGIITEGDFVRRVLSQGKFSFKVGEVCTKSFVSISMEEDISQAAKLMGDKEVKRLVVTSHGKVVGVISLKDLISVSPSLYGFIGDKPIEHKLKTY